MALIDEVQARYSADFLRQLTNPDAPESATSIDTTRLSKAAADVEAEFPVYAGVAYDNTNDAHISIASTGVIVRLMERMGMAEDVIAPRRRSYQEGLQALARIGARDWVTPSTTSQLIPTRERIDETIRPDFDRSHLGDFLPEGIAGTQDGGE